MEVSKSTITPASRLMGEVTLARGQGDGFILPGQRKDVPNRELPAGRQKALSATGKKPAVASPQDNLGGSARYEAERTPASRLRESFEHPGKTLNFILDTGGSLPSKKDPICLRQP